MKIEILATKTCCHRMFLEGEFLRRGIDYETKYFEDDSSLWEKHEILSSPALLINDNKVIRGMPNPNEFNELISTQT